MIYWSIKIRAECRTENYSRTIFIRIVDNIFFRIAQNAKDGTVWSAIIFNDNSINFLCKFCDKLVSFFSHFTKYFDIFLLNAVYPAKFFPSLQFHGNEMGLEMQSRRAEEGEPWPPPPPSPSSSAWRTVSGLQHPHYNVIRSKSDCKTSPTDWDSRPGAAWTRSDWCRFIRQELKAQGSALFSPHHNHNHIFTLTFFPFNTQQT